MAVLAQPNFPSVQGHVRFILLFQAKTSQTTLHCLVRSMKLLILHFCHKRLKLFGKKRDFIDRGLLPNTACPARRQCSLLSLSICFMMWRSLLGSPLTVAPTDTETTAGIRTTARIAATTEEAAVTTAATTAEPEVQTTRAARPART